MSEINSAVKTVLDSIDDKKKEQIREMILKMGIKPSDPLFNLHAELGSTQGILEQLPVKLQSIVTGWIKMVDDKLDAASDVAVQQQKSAIAQAAYELLKKHKSESKSAPVLPVVGSGVSNLRLAQISLVLGFVLALGTGIGAFTYNIVAGKSSSNQPTLSAADQKLLKWSRSTQGQLARRIMERNSPIIETCRQNKKKKEGCVIIVD